MSFTLNNPFQYWTFPNKSMAVGGGKLYVGLPDLDPTTPANQVTVKALQQDGSLVTLSQPVLLLAGGVPSYNGSPVQLQTDAAEVSVKLTTSIGAQVYYAERVSVQISADESVITASHIKSLQGLSLSDGMQVNVTAFFDGWAALNKPPYGGGLFTWSASTPKSQHNGGTIIAPEAITAWNGTHSGLSALFNWVGSGNGCYVREIGDAIFAESFGLAGDGTSDDTTALNAAFKALQNSNVEKLEFQGKKDVLITDKVLLRASDKVVDGTGIRIMLGSSQAGLQFAGDRIKIIGFRGEQTNQSFTPTLIYIFNDATTKQSKYCKVIGVTGYSLYRGIHMYMGDNSSGAACYRHSLRDCEFVNQYLQKTWAGSFGISFDGPFAGDAAGNDSKCSDCYVAGYERNYIINNSIATQFSTCSGDGALYNFHYIGLSSGLRIIGGYYEYNEHFIGVIGTKYDLYLLYPSVANTVGTQIFGDSISFISGGWGVGTPTSNPISNGSFTTNSITGTSEVYSVNGHTFYSGVSKTSRGGLNIDGDWVFMPSASFSIMGLLNVDTIRGYTGGATPLRISNTSADASSKVVIATNSVDRVEVSFAGDFRPTVDTAVSLGDPSHRFSVVYAQTGTINTSDERAKTSIEQPSEAEKKAALEIKQSIGKFKMLDAIENKGDGARYHFGVGAQTVKRIMEKHGLKPAEYGFFCFDTWDNQIENIDGVDVVTQKAGNRYGIRYDELSMFILAAI